MCHEMRRHGYYIVKWEQKQRRDENVNFADVPARPLLLGNYWKRPANTGVNTDGGTELTGANFGAHGHEIPATQNLIL